MLIAFILVWNFFLLQAVRWLWIATVILVAFGTALNLATGVGTWYGNLNGLVAVVLLLLPATRRFFGTGKAAATA
jgi:hypothetical protein